MNFCPLCMKNGIKRKLRIFQINLEEAIWACEGKDCMWPFGYETPAFFQRMAVSCDWNESTLTKQSVPVSTELSLYTPPVTPGEPYSHSVNTLMEDRLSEPSPKSEPTSSKKESADVKIPLLESLELQRVSHDSTKENRCIAKEKNPGMNTCKVLPKITNIQKTNIDITAILHSVNKFFNNENVQKDKQSYVNASSATGIAKDTSFDNELYKEFNLNMQYNVDNTQSKSENVQLDVTPNYLETNLNTQTLSEAVSSGINIDISDSNMINDPALDTLDSDLNIDAMLEHILDDKSIIENVDEDDLLNFLQF